MLEKPSEKQTMAPTDAKSSTPKGDRNGNYVQKNSTNSRTKEKTRPSTSSGYFSRSSKSSNRDSSQSEEGVDSETEEELERQIAAKRAQLAALKQCLT